MFRIFNTRPTQKGAWWVFQFSMIRFLILRNCKVSVDRLAEVYSWWLDGRQVQTLQQLISGKSSHLLIQSDKQVYTDRQTGRQTKAAPRMPVGAAVGHHRRRAALQQKLSTKMTVNDRRPQWEGRTRLSRALATISSLAIGITFTCLPLTPPAHPYTAKIERRVARCQVRNND